MKTQANEEMSAYYKATKSYKNQVLIFATLLILVVLAFILYIYISVSTIYVSIPGQTFKASRAYSNPYILIDAEQLMIDFCQSMHTFDPLTYEINLEKAKKLAKKEVYENIYQNYYVTPTENKNSSATNWILNDIIVEIRADSINSYYSEGEGEIIVDWYGAQIYKKDYNSNMRDELLIMYRAQMTPLETKTVGNRLGLKIVNFISVAQSNLE